MSPTTQHGNPLPDYSASAPPPGYSAQVTDGEELLAATHTPLSSRRTGSYSRSWDHGIGIRVVLHELNEDVGSQMPVYHQRGLICGTIYQENPRNTLQVFLKIEGKLKLSVFGNNPHTSTIKVVDECYELWSKSRSQAGTSTIPNEIAFSSVLPTTFRDGDRDVSVPPSHEISLPGLPGLYSQCTYAVKILLVTRSPLWNKTKTFTIPFKYRPRSRPPVPLLTHDGIRPGCPIFHATIKRAPEVWFETLSILRCKPASGLAPVEVQLFMPSGRTFGLADEIPFHIQLTGTASSIQTLYRLLSPLSASSEFRALTPTLTNQSTRDSINSKYSVKENDDRNFVFFSVTLIRQVCVEVKDQAVWKSFSIGKGIIHPIPPPFELAVLADDAFLPPHSADHTEKIVNLDAAGEIQCQPDVDIGHFNGGKVQVKDFLVLQIAPFKKSDNARSPFFPLKMPVPVFIVTDSWSLMLPLNHLTRFGLWCHVRGPVYLASEELESGPFIWDAMSSKLFTPYPLPTQLRSSLFKTPTDGVVPPIDELEALHAELKNLKARTMEKARRAGEDLKVLEEGMRRMKDRAKKGKEREGKEKVKRERDFSTTPLPDFADDIQPLLSSSGASGSKPRFSSHPLNNLPSSSRSSMDPERDKKKKKKRKRDLLEESDIEMVDAGSPRIRKGTPPIPHPSHSISSSSSIPPAPKAAKSISSSSIPKNSTQYHTGIDFTVPAPLTILPPRPPIQPPPIPAPSHPTLVSEDFSKIAKAPTQVAIAAFYSSVEPYLRVIKEEDVGFLSWEGDDIEPFVMPKLGRHYLEVWEEQDRLGLTTSSSALGTLQQVALNGGDIPPNPSAVAPNPSFDPSTLSESDTQLEHLGHGPLTERLISALLPMPDSHLTWKGVKAAEDAMEGRPGGSGAAASRKEKLSVSDLERRIGDTMRWYNLLPSGSNVQPLDYSNKTDDPIATALRINQAELRRVSAINRLRKARYAEIARDRVAWAEYLELRESIDRNITNVYNKLQKMQKAQRDAPKLGRKKKFKSEESTPVKGVNGSNGNGSVNGDTPPLPLCPAALGLGPDEDNQLVVSETLKQLVQTRRNWVKLGETLLDEKEGPLEVIELMEPGESSPEPNAEDLSSSPGVNDNSSSKWRVPVMERPRRGRLVGFPKESIFKGIEEEVEELMRDWERHNVEREQAEGQAKIPTTTNSRVGATTVPHSNDTSTSGSGLKIHLNGHVQATYGKGKGKARDDQMDVG